MSKVVRGYTNPPRQHLPIRDELAYERLPQIVQQAVEAFHGDGPTLLTAVISRTSHLDRMEQLKIQSDLLRALGYAAQES